jgi:hypothetical protein
MRSRIDGTTLAQTRGKTNFKISPPNFFDDTRRGMQGKPCLWSVL